MLQVELWFWMILKSMSQVVSWYQFTTNCGYTELAEACLNFIKWLLVALRWTIIHRLHLKNQFQVELHSGLHLNRLASPGTWFSSSPPCTPTSPPNTPTSPPTAASASSPPTWLPLSQSSTPSQLRPRERLTMTPNCQKLKIIENWWKIENHLGGVAEVCAVHPHNLVALQEVCYIVSLSLPRSDQMTMTNALWSPWKRGVSSIGH